MTRKQRQITIEGELPKSRHTLEHNEIKHMTVSHFLHIHDVEWVAPDVSDLIRIGQAASRMYKECYGEKPPKTPVIHRQQNGNGDEVYFEREYNAYPEDLIEMAVCQVKKATPC